MDQLNNRSLEDAHSNHLTFFRCHPGQVSQEFRGVTPKDNGPSYGINGSKFQEDFDEVSLTTGRRGSPASGISESWNTLDNIAALGLSFTADDPTNDDNPQPERFSLDDNEIVANRPLHSEDDRPFDRWLKSLQRKAIRRRHTLSAQGDRSGMEQSFSPIATSSIKHNKSLSGSSFGFVTAMKSASVSLASFSIATRSRRTAKSSRHKRSDRSSNQQTGRHSDDSSFLSRSFVDEEVTGRLLQRRRVIEEIISTEESYLADIRFLMNVYATLLATIPTLSVNLRTSINANLNEIIDLHEQLLGDLHRKVPHSEYTQSGNVSISPMVNPGHNRWRSLDAVAENSSAASWLQTVPGMTAEPKVAAAVAKAFGKRMNRFFVYEEYGAKYEMMIKDVASTHRTMPQWDSYQKGLEALASSFTSINAQGHGSKKALSVGDLLVKPIQRVCKYPLLFAELLKQTPVCDCPDSHMEIEDVLIRMREATAEINRATDDPHMKAILEKTWLLQDRLLFPDTSGAHSKSVVRTLGRIQLCGVLHVSWQTKNGVDGQYLICLLYHDILILASASKSDQVYTVQASIGLSELRVEEVDNGKGLQCHTAPFSWKIVFQYDHQLFEIMMSACSSKEEFQWRNRLTDRASQEESETIERVVLASLSLNVKAMGTIFGKPGTIARRISIHRATTIGPTSGLSHVIIKNTNAFKELPHSASSISINRSQSLLMTNRIPVLSPSRAERIRLECLLSDVWTRDVLPFPGMTGRPRNEHPVRSSASSMIRKLSVASIASNFTKRSGSMPSLHQTTEDEASIDFDLYNIAAARTSPKAIETTNLPEIEATPQSGLPLVPDEKENMARDFSDNVLSETPNGSPISDMRRLATRKGKGSWARDSQRIITPPLRTSTANSMGQRKVTPLSNFQDSVGEEKENVPQAALGAKPSKWTKGSNHNKGVVAEGLRNLFR